MNIGDTACQPWKMSMAIANRFHLLFLFLYFVTLAKTI